MGGGVYPFLNIEVGNQEASRQQISPFPSVPRTISGKTKEKIRRSWHIFPEEPTAFYLAQKLKAKKKFVCCFWSFL